VLSAADLAFWDEHGYVIVHDAVPEASRAPRRRQFSIMSVPSWTIRSRGIDPMITHHGAVLSTSGLHGESPVAAVHKAFAQLWKRGPVVSTDRAGFNVPERRAGCFAVPICIGM